MKLKGRRAIVTGGSSGIGEAVVRLFCQEGARVMISDINESSGVALAEEMKALGADAFFCKTNVLSQQEVEASVQAAADRFGGLDILVNSAGVLEDDNLLENVPYETWQQVIGINLGGVFLNAKYALPHLRESKGCIVNLASVGGLVASHNDPSYCASKGGVVNLTRSIAIDYSQFGVRCNAVAPSVCDSPMFRNYMAKIGVGPEELAAKVKEWGGPGGRFCTPDEVARAVLFLATDDAGYINGVTLPVDGGFTAV